jgi:V-type H+-transporting ATPase subunit A
MCTCTIRAKEILAQQDNLQEIVQLVGKESLSEDQKVVMDIAEMIVEDFLYQNAFTPYDFMCPLPKSIGMLKCIITMYEQSQRVISESSSEKKITWAYIKATLAHVIEKVKACKFEDPKEDGAVLKAHYDKVAKEIEDAFLVIADS